MSVPYRKTPKADTSDCAGYVEIVWLPSARTFYGGLLLIDDRGRPLEFVHNTLNAPVGFLWPDDQVRSLGVATLCHSLFDACRREPALLVCRDTLGTPAYCKAEIAPMIPLAQVDGPLDQAPGGWSWVNDPPPPAMGAHGLAEALRTRGLAIEPFTRIRLGLREVYPQAPWQEASDDPVRGRS